jgi:hypothetical protein
MQREGSVKSSIGGAIVGAIICGMIGGIAAAYFGWYAVVILSVTAAAIGCFLLALRRLGIW